MTAETTWVDFRDPPVSEVVVAVAFRPVPNLTVAHMGLFWRDHLIENFPHVEEQPPYDPPVERFDGPASVGPSLTFDTGFPAPRLWFKRADGQELVQVQRDWFACNWRKVDPDDAYGRWPPRRKAFAEWYGAFAAFVADSGLGPLHPTQCEVTYVNHIHRAGVWDRHGELDRVLTLAGRARNFLPSPEEISLRAQYQITVDGQPAGRLHIQSRPVFSRRDGEPAHLLDLTARGAPADDSLEGVLRFLDLGREWVTRAFKDVTTDEMHAAWGDNDA